MLGYKNVNICHLIYILWRKFLILIIFLIVKIMCTHFRKHEKEGKNDHNNITHFGVFSPHTPFFYAYK